MDWKEDYKAKLMSAEDAVKMVKSGDRIYVGTASSVSYALLDALWERRHELKDVTLMGSNGYQYNKCYYEKEDNPFKFCTYFMGVNERAAAKAGLEVNYTSTHLSEINIWSRNVAKPDICFFEVSEPDSDGYMSYGPSGVALHDKLKEICPRIILQVNKNTPFALGDMNLINVDEADIIVEADREYQPYTTKDPDSTSKLIASYILDEIHDGDTFQLGIGNISTAIGYGLRTKNDLGIHTEMLNEPMLKLIQSGNVTNKYKGLWNGKTVYSFCIGSNELYNALNHNAKFYALPFNEANDPRQICKNKNMVSINSTMAINLFGEAASDCVGFRQQSGVGGQVDFVKGAEWSKGGRSFLVTQSYFEKNGVKHSKILPYFAPGTIITTTRSDIQYVATEYGCVNLKNLTMQKRAEALIELAHPDFRPDLKTEAIKYGIIKVR